MYRLAASTLLIAATLTGCAAKPKPLPPAAEIAPPIQAAAPPPLAAGGAPAAPAPFAPLTGLQEQFAAAAGDLVHFEVDSTTLSREALAVLDRQADWLSAHPGLTVLIAGNCDERGTREYNLALGARRARAVYEYLMARGVPQQRLRTISYGKERPLDPGSDERAWANNRNARTLVGA